MSRSPLRWGHGCTLCAGRRELPIGWRVIFYRTHRLPWRGTSLSLEYAVVLSHPALQEVSFILSTGNAVIGKIGGMQGFFLIRNNVLKKNHACMPT